MTIEAILVIGDEASILAVCARMLEHDLTSHQRWILATFSGQSMQLSEIHVHI